MRRPVSRRAAILMTAASVAALAVTRDARAQGGAMCGAPLQTDVFFDWSSAKLSPRALKELREFRAKAGPYFSGPFELAVIGNADASERNPTLLSEQRANAVVEALEHLGLSPATIEVQAKGNTAPDVKTDPGVREPSNRGVRIIASAHC